MRHRITPFRVLFASIGFTVISVLTCHIDENRQIHWAVDSGDVAEIERILDKHPEHIENRIYRGGPTPLINAVWNNQIDSVRILLRRGADLNATCSLSSNDGNWNALHVAGIEGRVEAAKVLIEAGIDTNLKSMKGETPLDIAVKNHHRALADLIRSKGGVTGRDH
jgi:ankyrin repeat protein